MSKPVGSVSDSVTAPVACLHSRVPLHRPSQFLSPQLLQVTEVRRQPGSQRTVFSASAIFKSSGIGGSHAVSEKLRPTAS